LHVCQLPASCINGHHLRGSLHPQCGFLNTYEDIKTTPPYPKTDIWKITDRSEKSCRGYTDIAFIKNLLRCCTPIHGKRKQKRYTSFQFCSVHTEQKRSASIHCPAGSGKRNKYAPNITAPSNLVRNNWKGIKRSDVSNITLRAAMQWVGLGQVWVKARVRATQIHLKAVCHQTKLATPTRIFRKFRMPCEGYGGRLRPCEEKTNTLQEIENQED
jgi:hypothetical protein